MELNSVKNAFDQVVKNQRLCSSKAQEVIDQVGQEIESALTKMQSKQSCNLPDNKFVLTELYIKLEEMKPVKQLEGSQKQLNVGICKYAEALEKTFVTDISKAYRNIDFDSQTINQIIGSHFYHQSLFDLGDLFAAESHEPAASTLKIPFHKMYQILEAMKTGDLEPALAWAALHRDTLLLNGSRLELKIHTVQFMEILKKGVISDALNYAKTRLEPLSSTYMNEIQKLMASVIWVGQPYKSEYAEFLSPIQQEKLCEELAQQFYYLLGQSSESPLRVSIAAGFKCLPSLLKLACLMPAKKRNWKAMEQLPVVFDLGREFQFHSIFVCPVLKEPVTRFNPPMLMPCGHVLCHKVISKLSKGGICIFKCLFCPQKVTSVKCRQLFF